MKKYIVFSLFFLILLLPLCGKVFASSFQYGEIVTVETDSNAYVAGKMIQVKKAVDGDAYLAGESIVINAPLSQDAYLAGANITINEPIGDDLHVFGGQIIINAPIKGDLIALGEKIYLSEECTIGGDIILTASIIDSSASVAGESRYMARTASIQGKHTGDVYFNIGEEVAARNGASFAGNVQVSIPHEGRSIIPPEIVGGELKHTFTEENIDKSDSAFTKLLSVFSLSFFVSHIIILAVLLAFSRNFAIKYGDSIFKKKGIWKTLGYGLLALFVPPVLSIPFFLLIIPIPVAILLLVFWGSALYIASLLSGLIVANAIFKLKKEDTYIVMLGKYAIGLLSLSLIGHLPVIGILISFFIYILSLGSLIVYYKTAMKSLRRARVV